jgi:hypothetical protein
VLICSSNQGKLVTQYQPNMKNDILESIMQHLDGINGELE